MASLLRYLRNVVKMFFRFSEINFHAPQTKGSREGALFRRYYFVTTGSAGLDGLLHEAFRGQFPLAYKRSDGLLPDLLLY